MLEQLLEWDRATFIYLNNLGVERFDPFWQFATNISSWTPLFLLFFLLFVFKYPRKEALFMTLSVVILVTLVLLTTDLVKEAVGRLRPNNDPEINSLVRILRNPSSYSFFSGHAATSMSVTTLVVLLVRKRLRWAWIFYIWPLLFAYSRIYAGVHYPLDIFAGGLFGLLMALVFYFLYRRVIEPYIVSTHPG